MDKLPDWALPGMNLMPDGRIRWRFYVETPTGAVRKPVYGFSLKELKQKREELERKMKAAPTAITLNELLDRYSEHRIAEGYDERGNNDIMQGLAKYVRPGLGRHTLATLCTSWSIIGDHFCELSRKRPNARVIQMCYDETRRAFRLAVTKQWCNLNPFDNLSGVRPKYRSKSPELLTIAECLKLINMSRGMDRVLVTYWLCTGSRSWSEVLALRVRDVNFLHGIVNLSTFAKRNAKQQYIEKAAGERGKTERAARVIPLVPALAQMLEQHIADNNLGPDDYIFGNAKGGMLDGNNWRSRKWKPLVLALGRPDASPYDLRHTCNSFLAELGVPSDIRAAICGHGEEVNKRIYTHHSLEAKREAMAKLGALLERAAAA